MNIGKYDYMVTLRHIHTLIRHGYIGVSRYKDIGIYRYDTMLIDSARESVRSIVSDIMVLIDIL